MDKQEAVMKQLLIFTDFFGTIDKARVEDFFTLFSLIRKYCDKKGYDNFSFNTVVGMRSRYLYSDIFLEVKYKLKETFSFDVYPNLIGVEKKCALDGLIERSALSKNGNDEVPKDHPITEEVLYFDDEPFPDLVAPYNKRSYEENYDIKFNCVVVKNNIYSIINFFEKELRDIKTRGSKTSI